MTKPYDIEHWRRVLVYGLGLSGCAAVRLLLERGRDDLRVLGIDARPPGDLDLGGLADLLEGPAGDRFEIRAGDEPIRLPEGVDAVVVSPGVPLDRPLLEEARGNRVPVVAEVELAYRFLDGPVVAVTGSNGKSTTTALAGAMLREAGFDARVCGNIGEPLSSQVTGRGNGRPSEADRKPVYVVELSSFQLSTIHSFRPRAAVLLNVAADHLDRHGTLEEYAAAKRRIFENQRGGLEDADVAVLAADDPIVSATEVPGRRRLFSRAAPVEDGCFVRSGPGGGLVIERGRFAQHGDGPGGPAGETELFATADVPLEGAHNLSNAMAAALLARSLGATPEDLRRGLASFRGLPHRMERVAAAGGVTWYDDSKGTNPAATLGCLEGLEDGSVHLILGGRNKGNDFSVLAPAVARKARRVYLIGEAAGEIERALTGGRAGAEERAISRSGTLAEAVREAAERARPGETVLLSPACASFDQFRDFNHRGDAFQHLVHAVTTTDAGGAGGQEAGV